MMMITISDDADVGDNDDTTNDDDDGGDDGDDDGRLIIHFPLHLLFSCFPFNIYSHSHRFFHNHRYIIIQRDRSRCF